MAAPFIQLVSSRSVTAAGNIGTPLNLRELFGNGGGPIDDPFAMIVQAQVTALTGSATPGITVLIEDSVDGTVFRTVGTFTAITSVTQQTINIAPSGVAQAAGFIWPFNAASVRVRWTVQGTNPNVTFNVKAVRA
jgi:hypothetical protein